MIIIIHQTPSGVSNGIIIHLTPSGVPRIMITIHLTPSGVPCLSKSKVHLSKSKVHLKAVCCFVILFNAKLVWL